MGERPEVCPFRESRPVLFSLWEQLADPLRSPEVKLGQAIDTIADHLDMPLGYVARIDDSAGDYQVVFPDSLPNGLSTEQVFPLESTYCRKTIEDPTGRLAVTAAQEEGWKDDPAYREFGLESYIGVVLEDTSGLYGTLCFGDYAEKDAGFDKADMTMVELLKQWTSTHLQVDIPLLPFDRALAGRRSPEARYMDTILGILQDPVRRDVIQALEAVNGNASVDQLVQDVDGPDSLAMGLVHQHLPKLEANEVIEWERETGVVRPGPGFSITHHVLQIVEATQKAPK